MEQVPDQQVGTDVVPTKQNQVEDDVPSLPATPVAVKENSSFPTFRSANMDDSGKPSPSLMRYDPSERVRDVVNFWKVFDLDGKRLKLDQQGLEVANNQEKSVRSRKKLAEVTKEFRKSGNAEVRAKKFGPLLRLYQEEIDKLTRRARFAEGGFLSLYKSLYEAPDPVSILSDAESDKRKVSELEFTVQRLQKEMVEYESEFSNLTNQDITIRKLEDQLALAEKEIDDRVTAALLEKESEMNEMIEAAKTELQYKNSQLESDLEEARTQAADVQRMYDQAQEQLFELRSDMEDKDAARQSENEILAEDAARSRALMESLKNEVKILQQKLEEEKAERFHGNTFKPSDRVIDLEDELLNKNEQIQLLESEIVKLKAEFGIVENEKIQERKDLEGKLEESLVEIEKMRNLVANGPKQETIDELQKQLRMFQTLEYNVDDEAGVEGDVTLSVSDSSRNDRILLTKVRKLEAEKTSLKNLLSQCQHELSEAGNKNESIMEQNEDMKQLIQKLENELQMKTLNRKSSSRSEIDHMSNNNATGVGEPRKSNNHREKEEESKDSQSAILLNALRMPDSAVNSNILESQGGAAIATPVVSVENSLEDDSSSMLTIVHEQRNRFRKRMLELESEKDSLAAKAINYSVQIQTLKSDNVKLYEKIKYLESYRLGSNAGLGNAHATSLNQNQMSEVRLNIRRLHVNQPVSHVEMKYKDMYEDQVNPFANFSKRERRNRVHGLNTVERLTYKASEFFLSNKYTRTFLFFYFVSLHLLVSFMLLFSTQTSYTKCTHSTSQMHTSSSAIPPNVLEHALSEHALGGAGTGS